MSGATLKRIKHPIREFSLDKTGRADLARLLTDLPALGGIHEATGAYTESLKPVHKQYVHNVSPEFMAASLESCALLCAIADALNPQRVIDLGCGLTSRVLRNYAALQAAPPSVYSVTDSNDWLEKTRSYLQEFNTDTNQLLKWTDIQPQDELQFDLVFHDMGNMETRAAALPWVLSHLAPGGIVILDDVHKKKYRAIVEETVPAAGFNLYSMRDLTLDGLGRFAMLATPIG